MKEILSHKSFNLVDAISFSGAILLAYHGFLFDSVVLFFLGEIISVALEE